MTGGITNSGAIIGLLNDGLELSGGSSVAGGINNSGIIMGVYKNALEVTDSRVTEGIINSGIIGGGVVGIKIGESGSVTGGITNSGTIMGGSSYGIEIDGSVGNIVNSGTIQTGLQYSLITINSGTLSGLSLTGSSAKLIGDMSAPGTDVTIKTGATFANTHAFEVKSFTVESGATFNMGPGTGFAFSPCYKLPEITSGSAPLDDAVRPMKAAARHGRAGNAFACDYIQPESTGVSAPLDDEARKSLAGNNFASGGPIFNTGIKVSGGFTNTGTIFVAGSVTGSITGNYAQTGLLKIGVSVESCNNDGYVDPLALGVAAQAKGAKSRANGHFASSCSGTITSFGKVIVASGTSTLSGATFAVAAGASCSLLTAGQTIAGVISSDGTMTGTFSSTVTDDCADLDFTAVQNGNAIDLVANGATAAPPPPTYYPTSPTPDTTILPTGGGTATLTGGQSVTVTENGKDGTAIALPPPITTPPTGTAPTPGAPTTNSVNMTLPGTGTISVSSNVADTQLGVAKITLPGATESVNTVTVSQGSASFTATEKGQAVAGLKNGIFVVSGSKDSQVSVDATGPNTTIGVKSADTIVVPTGSTGVSGTKVDLPSPTASDDQAVTVNLNIGGQELTIQSSQPNTTMTFEVVNIDGVQTPVMAVTGMAQVSSNGEDKPLVSIAGNVIKSGKSSGGGSQVCNTIVQASSDQSSDTVHVVTCYIVLEPGTFSAIGGGRGTGNNFAAIKDGIVWAGETAEFDKNGVVISAYVGSRSGDTDAVGDDMVPGGGKFTGSGGYNIGAFIPRLNGTPLRLNGAKLDESIFAVVKKALGVDILPSTPSQSAQGVLNFHYTGDLTGQGVQGAAIPQVTYGINSDTASVLPSRRVRVDTSRADGVSISAEGDVDVAVGGLVTTFVASVPDPKAFAARIALVLPDSTSILRWNGSWQVKAADGTTYVGRPLWSFWAATPGAAIFSTMENGNLLYSDNGIAQPLFPDFYDYDTLQATFRKELNDPNLTVLPRMDGTAVAMVNGVAYIIAPQWNAFQPPAGKPAWWVENNVFYIKNADGSAQGFTVK